MRQLPFKKSEPFTLGTELEFQIIDAINYNLSNSAKYLIRRIQEGPYQSLIKPELSQSMIEINSSVHYSAKELFAELNRMRNYLIYQANEMNILFCGGGAHPFQNWLAHKIFPTARFRKLARQYRYLAKSNTMFGQHIHIGCPNGDDALYLIHALARYVPHLIALSASSPFYHGIDTGYDSARLTIFNALPTCGVMPYLTSWKEFSDYYHHMRQLEVIESMKDLYWDIRPQPKFGTVEIRICDTPLSIQRAAVIAAYVQTIAAYLLTEKPLKITSESYLTYNYNRFQAARYGFSGDLINPTTLSRCQIRDDMINTIEQIQPYTKQLYNQNFMDQLKIILSQNENDARLLRGIYEKYGSYNEVVKKQCEIWRND